jgi:hypothetical protein
LLSNFTAGLLPKYIKKIKNVIKYHSNHFAVPSLADNKKIKKAIQGLSEQHYTLSWQQQG